MELLTPSIRARIEAMVLDAISRVPPNIRPTDSRFLEWVESLIRYNAQNPLGPAEEKPPVPGGIGIADQYHFSDSVLEELYMETGVNDPINVGFENPLRLEPGNWQIPTEWTDLQPPPLSGEYQGVFADIETTYEANNVSKAVGEDEPSDDVFLKKLQMGIFPPSVFTGMMRLYMQAYYGADNELTNQFSLKATPAGDWLLYCGILQIGFWSHLSGGIVRVGEDDDLDFRYVAISSLPGGGNYIVHEYPIVVAAAATPAINDYRDVESSDEDKEKALAYIFAHSRIRSTTPRVVDTFELDNEGASACYGWHFNNAGTKASICLTELFIDGSDKWNYDSSEVTLTFAEEIEPDGSITLVLDSVSETDKVRWCDKANVDIWRPNADNITCSRVYYTYPFSNRPTQYSYTDAPIYCWYNKEDDLQVVKLSHTEEDYELKKLFNWTPNIHPHAATVTDIAQLKQGWVLQNEAREFDQITTTNGTTDQVSVGTTDYDMVSSYGSYIHYDVPATTTHTVDGGGPYLITNFSTYSPNGLYGPGNSPDYEEWLEESRYGTDFKWQRGHQEYTRITGLYWIYEATCIHIPLDDAEAVEIASLKYASPESDETAFRKWIPKTDPSSHIIYQAASSTVPEPYSNDKFITWDDPLPDFGTTENQDSEFSAPGEIQSGLTMHIHSRTLDGVEGEYGGSSTTWFFRDADAENPLSKTFRESWGVAALRGSDLGALDDEYVEVGTWTGWI
jgi:hypothetical protein